MNQLTLSHHARTRMRQRGLRLPDLELIFHCATQINDDTCFLSRKDVEREIRCRKREIQALERLEGQKLIVADDTVVTCYRSSRRDQKRMRLPDVVSLSSVTHVKSHQRKRFQPRLRS